MPSKLARLSLLALVCLAIGCRSRSTGNDVPLTKGPPPTAQEVQAFADSLEQAALVDGRMDFAGHIDWIALVDQAMRDAGMADSGRNGRIALRSSAAEKAKASFTQTLNKTLIPGAKYKLLRIGRAADGLPLCTFRMTLPDAGGLNYHDLKLSRSLDGGIRAVDFLEYVSGDPMTLTLSRMFLLVKSEAQNPADPDSFLAHAGKLQRMKALSNLGKAAEVIQVFETLPPKVRTIKPILILRLAAAMELGDDVALKAIEEYRAAFPGDAASDLISIDMFVLKKNFDEALACLDRIDAKIGGDPYLDVLRAILKLEEGDTSSARAVADRAVARNPDEEDAHIARLSLSLKGKRHADTLEDLRQFERRFGIGNFAAVDEYAEFLKSPEYREWIMLHPFAKEKTADGAGDSFQPEGR